MNKMMFLTTIVIFVSVSWASTISTGPSAGLDTTTTSTWPLLDSNGTDGTIEDSTTVTSSSDDNVTTTLSTSDTDEPENVSSSEPMDKETTENPTSDSDLVEKRHTLKEEMGYALKMLVICLAIALFGIICFSILFSNACKTNKKHRNKHSFSPGKTYVDRRSRVVQQDSNRITAVAVKRDSTNL